VPDLKQFDLIYLATPYSRYPQSKGGIVGAFQDAAALTGRLLQSGLKVYSPIAHTHPIAVHGKLDPYDHLIWLPFDEAIMAKADALLVAGMDTWQTSFGIAHEIGVFTKAGKPIFYLDPETLETEDMANASA
jgi:nucleoside 2-deoxyribosyltransferase